MSTIGDSAEAAGVDFVLQRPWHNSTAGGTFVSLYGLLHSLIFASPLETHTIRRFPRLWIEYDQA